MEYEAAGCKVGSDERCSRLWRGVKDVETGGKGRSDGLYHT